MQRPLLSICIPTYNRADTLEMCLFALVPQVQEARGLIEVFITDNASADNTSEIISKYGPQFPIFWHHTQVQNLGPDLNIAECFRQAKGQYVWIFSDDDLILPGGLSNVLSVLQEKEPFGVLSLHPTFYPNELANAVIKNEFFRYEERRDPVAFMAERHIWFSFISGTITNKDLVTDISTLYDSNGTFLIQLGWTLPALFRAQRNAWLPTQLIVGKQQFVLSYNAMRVFSLGVIQVLDRLVAEGLVPILAKPAMCRSMLRSFLPELLSPAYQFKKGGKPFGLLTRAYWRYPEYWTHILPALAGRIYKPKVKKITAGAYGAVVKSFTKILSSSAWHRADQTRSKLRQVGIYSQVPLAHEIINPELVTIGRRFQAGAGLFIEAYKSKPDADAEMGVFIGDDVRIGNACHINCALRVEIGNHVLIGSNVSIVDYSRDTSPSALELPPIRRAKLAEGPVIIEDNVLIEDGVSIVGHVRIGRGSIIKAGSFINQDVNASSTIARVPR